LANPESGLMAGFLNTEPAGPIRRLMCVTSS
jgi:hypothetical protein